MKSPKSNQDWSRRKFLRGAGLFGMGSAVAALTSRRARADQSKPTEKVSPPVAYDVERFKKTDPKLVHFELAGALRSPHEEPHRLAFGMGELLFVTAGKVVSAIDQQGTTVLEFAASEEVRCLSLASDHTILLGLRDHIEIFDAQGKRQAKWDPPAAKAWVSSLAAGENDVFVSDAGNRILHHYNRAGKLLGRIGEKDKARNIPGFVVPSPYFDVKISRNGLLWVANPGRSQIEAYTFDGEFKTSWGEPSFGIAGFCGCCNPSYFALTPEGRFVTSEKGLARIKVYSAAGKFESVVAGAESFPKYFENVSATPIPMDVAVDATGRVLVADTLGNEIRIYKRKAQV